VRGRLERPEAAWNFDASETKGRSNWYGVSFNSRRRGLNRPPILSIGREATATFGGIRASSNNSSRNCRPVSGSAAGRVPHLTVGLVVLAQRHEAAAHVLQVVERMGLVERAEPAHPLAVQRRLHDVLGNGRRGATRTVVVGGAADRDAQPPVGVRA
jgi:hypothetical protein